MSNLIEVHVQPDLPLLLLVIGLLLRLLAAALVSLLRVGLVLFLLLLARFGVGHLWTDFGKVYSSRGGSSKAQGLAYLLPDPAAQGSIPSITECCGD